MAEWYLAGLWEPHIAAVDFTDVVSQTVTEFYNIVFVGG